MLTEMADSVGLVMLANGDDPTKVDDAASRGRSTGSRQRSTPARSASSPGNDYARPLAQGDLAAAIAWSGDVVQLLLDNENLEWAIPADGGMIWTDNMLIPTGGDVLHRLDVHELRLRPGDRRADRRVRELRHPGEGREGRARQDRSGDGEQPAHLPRPTRRSRRCRSSTPRRSTTRSYIEAGRRCSAPRSMSLLPPPPRARRRTCSWRRARVARASSSSSRSASSASSRSRTGSFDLGYVVHLGVRELLGRDQRPTTSS